jgi:hypothetical protein
LGAKKADEAEKMAATGVSVEPNSRASGDSSALPNAAMATPIANAETQILPVAKDYLRFILIASPFMVTSFMLNNLLRYQGSAMFSMIGMGSGAVLNVALDPLLIFGLGMGVSGAALATAISQTVSCLLLFFASCRSKGNLRKFALSAKACKEMVRGGSPPLLSQIVMSVSAVFLNQAAGGFSDAVIAAITIVNRVFLLAGLRDYRLRPELSACLRLQLRRDEIWTRKKGVQFLPEPFNLYDHRPVCYLLHIRAEYHRHVSR